MRSNDDFFFELLSGCHFLHVFVHFNRKLRKKESKRDAHSAEKLCLFRQLPQKVAQLGRKGGQGLQKDTKMEPQVTKMEPGGLQIEIFCDQKSC